MANTIKTITGEVLVSEIEAVVITQAGNLPPAAGKILPANKVTVTTKSGLSYDLMTGISAAQAAKVYTATINFVAGMGHQVFDATQVK